MKKFAVFLALTVALCVLAPVRGCAMDLFSDLLDLYEDLDDADVAGEDAPGRTFSGDWVSATLSTGTQVQVRSDFKRAMDDYEAYFDNYIEVVTAPDPDMAAMLTILGRYAEVMAEFEALDDADLTDGEALYYEDVSFRISMKLIEAGS